MSIVSKELDPMRWRQSGLRMDPVVRQALRVSAAKSGETMEKILHRILVRELREQDLLPASFAEER